MNGTAYLLARSVPISEAILSAGPYLQAAHGPQSKGVGQWQLRHAMQGEFAAEKYYELVLDDYFWGVARAGFSTNRRGWRPPSQPPRKN
jgi:hypothetical protein